MANDAYIRVRLRVIEEEIAGIKRRLDRRQAVKTENLEGIWAGAEITDDIEEAKCSWPA